MDHLSEPQKRWQDALDELQMQMTPATFDTWLRGTRVTGAEGNVVYVGVRHAYALDWMQNRMAPSIRGATERHFPPETEIRFVVDPGDAPQRTHRPPDAPDDGGGEQLDEPIIEAERVDRVQLGGAAGTLTWTDFYIKLKVAFRKRALRELKGAPLSVFICLALHVDRDGVASPGIEAIMRETGYSRSVVCNALETLVGLGLVTKRSSYRGCDEYIVNGYAWFGKQPARALWEEKS